MIREVFILVLGCLAISNAFTIKKTERLGQYNTDPNSVTVSGISSGAAMATMFHFAYSKEIKGAGMFAGGPYLCGYGSPLTAPLCMTTPSLTSVPWLNLKAEELGKTGLIDSTVHIKDSKVYIFHGTKDQVVDPGSGQNLKEMYEHFNASIHAEFSIEANHGQPVDGNGYGGDCGTLNIVKGFINECGYNGAYEMFNSLYGNENESLIRPEKGFVADGELLDFDQTDFFILGTLLVSMSTRGLVYVPKACADGAVQCRLHIAFHGCLANQLMVGEGYATKTNYIEVAELNNIVIVFPQTMSTPLSPMGCWDWFGYTGPASYPTKTGKQMVGVYRMMNRVLYGE